MTSVYISFSFFCLTHFGFAHIPNQSTHWYMHIYLCQNEVVVIKDIEVIGCNFFFITIWVMMSKLAHQTLMVDPPKLIVKIAYKHAEYSIILKGMANILHAELSWESSMYISFIDIQTAVVLEIFHQVKPKLAKLVWSISCLLITRDLVY